jgi:hypothetical protein
MAKGSNSPSPSRQTNADSIDSPASQLRQEYEAQQALLLLQPPLVQRFLESQARQLVDAIMQKLPQARFTLPDRVICLPEAGSEAKSLLIPKDDREQLAGGIIDRLTRTDLRTALRQRLFEMEGSQNPAMACAAQLIRHAVAMHMVHGMLPAGRTVTYRAADGEEIPSLPVENDQEPESALTAATDAIAEEGDREAGRGDLLVPYVPAARRFYLPQWVAFDDQDNLLVSSANEAEADLASMQRFLAVLHAAVSLAPYIVVDEEYQQKRYGMLGQLVNQGRAMARYQCQEIIRTIKRRASANDLNRGLSLSLPFFDDQTLEMKTHDFEVIPAGRIMFVPAFVVRAARREQAMVAQDTRLSPSTRKHLMDGLQTLEQAFETWKRPKTAGHS